MSERVSPSAIEVAFEFCEDGVRSPIGLRKGGAVLREDQNLSVRNDRAGRESEIEAVDSPTGQIKGEGGRVNSGFR